MTGCCDICFGPNSVTITEKDCNHMFLVLTRLPTSIVAEGAAVGVGLEVAVAVDEVVVEVALEAAGS